MVDHLFNFQRVKTTIFKFLFDNVRVFSHINYPYLLIKLVNLYFDVIY